MRTFMLIAGALALAGTPLAAQVRSVDPNDPAQTDVAPQPGERSYETSQQAEPPAMYETTVPSDTGAPSTVDPAAPGSPSAGAPAVPQGATYHKDDLIGAAEGVFGKGAQDLAGIIEKILKDQGEPNAYIAGREASAAIGVGLRYGSGTMSHKIEGQRPVYWTGPSIGFDVGGDAAKVFVLVYNLYDSQELYRRYPQVEGRAYFVGGFSATYLRRGDVVLIPVRLGVGVRLGANVGYMKFSEKSRWFPL